MPDPLTIDFSLTNTDKVTQFFGKLGSLSGEAARTLKAVESSAEAAARAYRALNAEVERFNRLTAGAGNSPAINIGRGVAPAGGGSSRASSRFVSGPFQRQQMLSQQMASAQSQGNGRAAADIALAQQRNDRLISRAQSGPKNIGDKFLDVLKTSRYGTGAGGKMELMPLVGRTANLAAEALGPEIMAIAGPVGVAVAAFTAAGSALFNLAKSAAEIGSAFSAQAFQMGGIGAGAARALTLGGPDAAGKASAFNAAITGSGTGRMFGMALGQFNIGGPYAGNLDTGGQYAAAVDRLRDIYKQSPMQAQRIAQNTGLTSSLSLGLSSDKQYAYTKTDAASKTQIMDPQFLKDSEDFNLALGRTSEAWQNMEVALGKPLLKSFTDLLNGMANALQGFAAFLDSKAGRLVIGLATSIASPASSFALAASGDGGANGGKEESLNKNTAALDKNTAAQMQGVFGSDPQGRLAKAFPEGSIGLGTNRNPFARADFAKMNRPLGAY